MTTASISDVLLVQDLIKASEVVDYFLHPEKIVADLVRHIVEHAVALHAGPVVAFIVGRLAGDLTEQALAPDGQSAATGEADSVLQVAYGVLDGQDSGIGTSPVTNRSSSSWVTCLPGRWRRLSSRAVVPRPDGSRNGRPTGRD